MPKLAEKTGLLASASGSWLIDISEQISKKYEVELAIAAVGGKQYQKHYIKKNVQIYSSSVNPSTIDSTEFLVERRLNILLLSLM